MGRLYKQIELISGLADMSWQGGAEVGRDKQNSMSHLGSSGLALEIMLKDFKLFVSSMSVSSQLSHSSFLDLSAFVEQFVEHLTLRGLRAEADFVKIIQICLKKNFALLQALSQRNSTDRKDRWESLRSSIHRPIQQLRQKSIVHHRLGGSVSGRQFLSIQTVKEQKEAECSTQELWTEWLQESTQRQGEKELQAFLNTMQFKLRRTKVSDCRQVLEEIEDEFYSGLRKAQRLARGQLLQLKKAQLQVKNYPDSTVLFQRVIDSLQKDHAALLLKVRAILQDFQSKVQNQAAMIIAQKDIHHSKPPSKIKTRRRDRQQAPPKHFMARGSQTLMLGSDLLRQQKEALSKEVKLQEMMSQQQQNRQMMNAMMLKTVRLENSGVELLQDMLTSVSFLPLGASMLLVFATNIVKLFKHYGIESKINLQDLIRPQPGSSHDQKKRSFRKLTNSLFDQLEYEDGQENQLESLRLIANQYKRRKILHSFFLPAMIIQPSKHKLKGVRSMTITDEFGIVVMPTIQPQQTVTEDKVFEEMKDTAESNNNSGISKHAFILPLVKEVRSPPRSNSKLFTTERKVKEASILKEDQPLHFVPEVRLRHKEEKRTLPRPILPVRAVVPKMDVFGIDENNDKLFQILKQPVQDIIRWLNLLQPSEIPIQLRAQTSQKDIKREIDKLVATHRDCKCPCVHLSNFIKKLTFARDFNQRR